MTRNPTLLLALLLPLLAVLLPLGGCAVHIPDPSAYSDLQVPEAVIAETQLLDIGIGQFSFEPPTLADGSPDLQVADIRSAESRYMPVMLRHSLTHAAAWGAIHVLPQASHSHDVLVEGTILDSESHTLRLKVRVLDATGALWFEKIYTEYAGDNVYGDDSLGVNDPFDGIYNRIANDMLLHVQTRLDANAIAGIRQVAELQFGNEFAPDVYGDYLVTSGNDIISVARMPPANDPAVVHLAEIRARNHAFQDLLQDHYVGFTREIARNYFEYRRQSFRELQALQQQQTDARNDIVGGAVLLGVAVATSNIDDAVGTIFSAGAAVAGAFELVKGVRNYTSEAPFLDEIAQSFAGDVVTEVVALDEEVVTLSGSTEEIYQQWKDVLRELFREDRSL